jgi:hypothetical protein
MFHSPHHCSRSLEAATDFASGITRTQAAWPSTAFWHCDKIATGEIMK